MAYTKKYKGRTRKARRSRNTRTRKARRSRQRGGNSATLRDPNLYNPVVDVVHSPEDPYAAPMLMSREDRDTLFEIQHDPSDIQEKEVVANGYSNNQKINKKNWNNVVKNNKAI